MLRPRLLRLTRRRLAGLDRYLTFWIFAAMGLGIAAGAAFPVFFFPWHTDQKHRAPGVEVL